MTACYNKELRFRFFGNVEKAQTLTNEARKFMGYLKESMGFQKLKFLTHEYRDAEGNIYRCMSNMNGLAAIDEVAIYAQLSSKEVDVCTGFIAKLTISADSNYPRYFDHKDFVLQIKQPTVYDAINCRVDRFSGFRSAKELGELKKSDHGDYNIEDVEDVLEIGGLYSHLFPASLRQHIYYDNIIAPVFELGLNPGLPDLSNWPFLAYRTTTAVIDTIVPANAVQSRTLPDIHYRLQFELTYIIDVEVEGAELSRLYPNEADAIRLQVSKYNTYMAEQSWVPLQNSFFLLNAENNNTALSKISSDKTYGYAPAEIKEIKEQPVVRTFTTDYELIDCVVIKKTDENSESNAFAVAKDGDTKFKISSTGNWPKDNSLVIPINSIGLEQTLWGNYSGYAAGVIYHLGTGGYWTKPDNHTIDDHRTTFHIDSFYKFPEWEIKTSTTKGDYDISVISSYQYEYDVDWKLEIELFGSRFKKTTLKGKVIKNTMKSDKKMIITLKEPKVYKLGDANLHIKIVENKD